MRKTNSFVVILKYITKYNIIAIYYKDGNSRQLTTKTTKIINIINIVWNVIIWKKK